MQTFVMLTRLSHADLESPESLKELEKSVMEHVTSSCPEVEWAASYSVLGPYDYLDVFLAPDVESATKVATAFRTFGHAEVEVWPATRWQRFKELVAA